MPGSSRPVWIIGGSPLCSPWQVLQVLIIMGGSAQIFAAILPNNINEENECTRFKLSGTDLIARVPVFFIGTVNCNSNIDCRLTHLYTDWIQVKSMPAMTMMQHNTAWNTFKACSHACIQICATIEIVHISWWCMQVQYFGSQFGKTHIKGSCEGIDEAWALLLHFLLIKRNQILVRMPYPQSVLIINNNDNYVIIKNAKPNPGQVGPSPSDKKYYIILF